MYEYIMSTTIMALPLAIETGCVRLHVITMKCSPTFSFLQGLLSHPEDSPPKTLHADLLGISECETAAEPARNLTFSAFCNIEIVNLFILSESERLKEEKWLATCLTGRAGGPASLNAEIIIIIK